MLDSMTGKEGWMELYLAPETALGSVAPALLLGHMQNHHVGEVPSSQRLLTSTRNTW